MAIVMLLFMRQTSMRGEVPPFIMELPAYHAPQFRSLMIHLWDKLKHYVKKACTIIVASSIVIWFLSHFAWDWSYLEDELMNRSILADIGNFLLWICTPMGFGLQLSEFGWVFRRRGGHGPHREGERHLHLLRAGRGDRRGRRGRRRRRRRERYRRGRHADAADGHHLAGADRVLRVQYAHGALFRGGRRSSRARRRRASSNSRSPSGCSHRTSRPPASTSCSAGRGRSRSSSCSSPRSSHSSSCGIKASSVSAGKGRRLPAAKE